MILGHLEYTRYNKKRNNKLWISMREQLPERIHEWLAKRGLTDEVLERFDVHWNGRQIVLPVHDEFGNVLFNKYRRDPEVAEGPKYRYDKGATSALYGIYRYENTARTVICEGELDCLALLSKGISAVTSTGGAAAFNPEWRHKLSEQLYICFDNDEAGYKGAFKLHGHLTLSRVVFLPREVKDVTEFFVKLEKGKEDFKHLCDKAITYALPQDWQEAKDKKELNAFVRYYKREIDRLMQEARMLRTSYEPDAAIQVLIDMYLHKFNEATRAVKYYGKGRAAVKSDLITAAKVVPIPQFVKFNNQRFGKCVWHADKNPSMYYYAHQNRVHCFACDKTGDVIDVVQQTNRCTLKEAVELILQKA